MSFSKLGLIDSVAPFTRIKPLVPSLLPLSHVPLLLSRANLGNGDPLP